MFQTEVYKTRREQLRKRLNSGIALFLGNVDVPFNYPANIYRFRQDSSFLYFFGLNAPKLAGVVDFDSGEDTLFGDDIELGDIIWMGEQPSMASKAERVGVKNSLPYCKLAETLKAAITAGRKIHFLPPYRAESKIELVSLLGIKACELKTYSSTELVKAVVALREIKDIHEITEIEKAVDVAYLMHTTSMRMAHPGIWEQKIAGTIEGIALQHGGTVSFPVILSVNGQILHNHAHDNILVAGRMMVTDAGYESPMCYAADITRTVPVGGKFDSRQREIYQIVLDANMYVQNNCKPGASYRDMHLGAAKVIAGGLVNAGLMKGNVDEIVAEGAHALFFPHGLGHAMGLDVHDMEDLGENFVGYDESVQRSKQFGLAYLRMAKQLKTGMVMTNEPGIYFIPALIDTWKAENKFTQFINYDKLESYRDFGGIRIEDDLLITESGCRVLGKAIPKTIDDIETCMRDALS